MEMILKSGDRLYDANAALAHGGGYDVTVNVNPFPESRGPEEMPVIEKKRYKTGLGGLVVGEMNYRVLQRGSRYYVKAGAETFEFEKWERDDLFSLIENESALGKSEVYPPMPGSVVAVMAENGQEVKKGQKIMVIEAMKMETTLVAEMDGVLSGINLKQGDRFDSDTMLFSISKSGN